METEAPAEVSGKKTKKKKQKAADAEDDVAIDTNGDAVEDHKSERKKKKKEKRKLEQEMEVDDQAEDDGANGVTSEQEGTAKKKNKKDSNGEAFDAGAVLLFFFINELNGQLSCLARRFNKKYLDVK